MNEWNLCAARPDGTLSWRDKTGYMWPAYWSAPAIGSDGTIYTLARMRETESFRMLAFDPEGELRWAFDMDKTTDPTLPSVDDLGTVYVGDSLGHNLYAVDAAGKLKWLFKAASSLGPGAAVIGKDRTIYFGTSGGTLYALDQDGKLKWQFQTGGNILSAPVIDADGNIYFASFDRKFYCVDSNGWLKGVVLISAGFGTPVMANDGTIYLLDKGGLYAIRGFAPPSAGPWPMKRHDARGTARVSPHDTNVGSLGATKSQP